MARACTPQAHCATVNLLLFSFVLPTLAEATGVALAGEAVGVPAWVPFGALVALYVLPCFRVGETLHRALWSLALLGYVAGALRGFL